jgi:hypothetical protein
MLTVFLRMRCVTMGCVGMVGSLFMIAGIIVLGSFPMMTCSMGMVF